MKKRLLAMIAGMISLPAWGHGHTHDFEHFLPTTIAIEDPFVGDEANFGFGHVATGEPRQDRLEALESAEEDDSVGEDIKINVASVEITKLIMPRLQFSVAGEYVWEDADNHPNGLDNVEVGLKYMAYHNAKTKTVFSLGLEAELGRSGSRAIRENDSSAISPQLFFGQGLLDGKAAVTGFVAPVYEADFASVEYGATLQYFIPIGLRCFHHIVPVIEVPLSTCYEDECENQTTGSVNPGLILWGDKIQFAAEGVVPLNRRSGDGLGFLMQLHWHY